MSAGDAPARSIVVERQMPYPPDKIWRALTEGALLAEWLMENDFRPVPRHKFTMRAKPMPGWSGIIHCEVLELDAPHRLVFRWGDGSESDTNLSTIVTWTLTPRGDGTAVRMEQAGFGPEHDMPYERMGKGWPHILDRLDQVAARL